MNKIIFPYLNPVHFVDINNTENEKYRSKTFVENFYADTINEWEFRKLYFQKWQNSDILYLQFQSNFQPIQLELLNCYGHVIHSWASSYQLPNRHEPTMYVYQITASFASIPEGKYMLRLTNGDLDELNFVSEPIFISQKHSENTVLFKYSNSRFHGDVIFETGIEFEFRVEGTFDKMVPGNKLTAYEDQTLNPVLLSSRPFRVFPLVVGGSFGVPDWVIDKLNYIWSCNRVFVDGKLYARTEDAAEFEINGEENYPMRAVTMLLREGLNRNSQIINPSINTDVELVVSYNINTRLFGSTAGQGAGTGGIDLTPIISTE